MAPAAEATGRAHAEINVTPMIDVLLVLVIIFMLLNLLRTTIPVQLAPSEPGVVGAPPIVLELPDDGGYQVNGQPVPAAQLDMFLRLVFAERPAKLLYVKPGVARSYQEVVTAMDLARGAGVQVIGLVPREAYAAKR